MGWVVVRVSRDAYIGVRNDQLDFIDDEVDARDRDLWSRLFAWLEANAEDWMRWHFVEALNNARGVLQVFVSRNHRSSSLWELMDWIAENGPGSYGLIYVWDDEDNGHGREVRIQDHSNEFRVWRILNGKVEEFADPFLSPIVPVINPTFYA
jgi:hypothetical protein